MLLDGVDHELHGGRGRWLNEDDSLELAKSFERSAVKFSGRGELEAFRVFDAQGRK